MLFPLPEVIGRIGLTLHRMVPGRAADPKSNDLKRLGREQKWPATALVIDVDPLTLL